jgi:uncharacterized protein (DUF697 family)
VCYWFYIASERLFELTNVEPEDSRMRKGTEATVSEPATPADQSRDALAAKVVDRYVLWSGAAGLIPLPLLDMTAVAGVQLQMLRRIAEIYGVKFSENLGKSVLASLIGSMIPATSGMGVASALKAVPLIGTTVAVLSMPALSAGATYLIGRVFMQHFASGGTFLDFNPPDYREFIKEQADKLKAKLDAPSSSSQSSVTTSTAQSKRTANSST